MADEDSKAIATLPSDLVLVIFIHGFKGTDTTFSSFPERLQHVLSKTIEGVKVECIVFPEYETKGDLTVAVARFSEWLTKLTVDREVACGLGGGAGKAKIVLCGHSMGGLLAADALIQFVQSRPDQNAPLWPRIVACLAFDTPYLGLNPNVFKHGATKAAEFVDSAKTAINDVFSTFKNLNNQGSSSPAPSAKQGVLAIESAATTTDNWWTKWGSTVVAVGGAVAAAGAAAGAAYMKRDNLEIGYSWATDHMKYVGNLWDEESLGKRLERVVALERLEKVLFRTYYTVIPATPPSFPYQRTFIRLPPDIDSQPAMGPDELIDDRVPTHFLTATNSLATDEIEAHTGMFEAKSNDGYYQLGLEVSRIIREAVMLNRGVIEAESERVAKDIAANDELANAMEDVKESKRTVIQAVEEGANKSSG